MAFPTLSLQQLKKGSLTAPDIQGSARTGEKSLGPAHPIPRKKKPESFKPGLKFMGPFSVVFVGIILQNLFLVRGAA
jgi:hypothetical protein